MFVNVQNLFSRSKSVNEPTFLQDLEFVLGQENNQAWSFTGVNLFINEQSRMEFLRGQFIY